MPSFAELKEKAIKAKDASVEKIQNTRDRHTSVPLAKTNWDPYSKKPPPPPPAPRQTASSSFPPPPPPPGRPPASASASGTPDPPPAPPPSIASRINAFNNSTSSPPPPPPPRTAPPISSAAPNGTPPPPPARSASVRGGPPPIVNEARPGYLSRSAAVSSPALPSRPGSSAGSSPAPIAAPAPSYLSRPAFARTNTIGSNSDVGSQRIDWRNLTQEDKEVFFSWLDEFFSRHLNVTIGPSQSEAQAGEGRTTTASSWSSPTIKFPVPSVPPTRDLSGHNATSGASDWVLSHPPPSEHGSSALDLAYYFHSSTAWSEAWYNSSTMSLPPPLKDPEISKHVTWIGSWKSVGPNKTIYMSILFADLSMFWGTIQYSTNSYNPLGQEQRTAVYLPRPEPLSGEELLTAHETYGETIASFAESYAGSGEYCGRGECWDLAAEALKYFKEFDYVPPPVGSLSRTHGHLIYEAKASKIGGRVEMVGRWRGGDDRMRRGDIIEWRRAKIVNETILPSGGRRTSTRSLGAPDHTAIIVQDLVPLDPVGDGQELRPDRFDGVMVVVDQSVSTGGLPERKELDLTGLQEGEIWVYRPVGMESYLGVSGLVVEAPEGNDKLLRLE
ncbi:hypothetical protein AX16_009324 [Volvariella volvacea WC 439]|nr:hypothetical protein AX16_009324 [Volvariella volvacea WC 439]